MKFHALTLGLAGTLVASAASAQDTKYDSHRMHDKVHTGNTARTDERVDRSSWPIQKPFYTKRNWPNNVSGTYTQEFPFYKQRTWAYGPVTEIVPERMAFYPDLTPLSEVAAKIQEIHRHNAHEAAEFRALANRARALGWTNIAAVYDQIAADHTRGGTMAANWLTDHDFAVPAMPTTTTVSDTMSETDVRNSVDRMLAAHLKMYNETSDKLHNEKSSTVRGMYLMQLTTIDRHINWLQLLDRDVDRGRRDLSARLASQLDATRSTRTAREWDTMIFEEEWSLIQTTRGTTVAQTPYIVPPDAEIRYVDRPVIIERVVERPVPATQPAPQPTFSAPVTSVETVTTAPQATVAGRRQTRARRPARRPAK